MSYLVQNYFNNFQVRNPILKNPTSYSPPLTLTKVRPSQLATGTAPAERLLVNVNDLSGGALRVTPLHAVNYYLPSANQLIGWLGTRNSGQISSPAVSTSVQQGDILMIPVINNALTGCNIVPGENVTGTADSTGALYVHPRSSATNKYGSVSTLVIDFKTVINSSSGYSGAYNIYGLTGCNL
uniref:Uncharacterized protein n=1 Tax=viral metagenome TaxID=1070528 RepID=A0A6C0I6U0_9ZZZZ